MWSGDHILEMPRLGNFFLIIVLRFIHDESDEAF